MKLLKVKWSGKRALITLALAAGVWLLYVQGSQAREADGGGEEPTSETTTQCRVESTADGLNVRSTPTVAPRNVVDQLAQGEEVDADKVVENGFRKLGEGRWVSVEYVRTVDGRDCG